MTEYVSCYMSWRWREGRSCQLICWWESMLVRPGRTKCIVRVYWKHLAESPVRTSFNFHCRQTLFSVVLERRVYWIVEPHIQRSSVVFIGATKQWTRPTIIAESWRAHESLPNQSKCALWTWEGIRPCPSGVLGVYGVLDNLLRSVRSLYNRCWSLVYIASSESKR